MVLEEELQPHQRVESRAALEVDPNIEVAVVVTLISGDRSEQRESSDAESLRSFGRRELTRSSRRSP